MDVEKLQELLNIFEASGLSEIEIEEGGTRIRLKKSAPEQPGVVPVYAAPAAPRLEIPVPAGAAAAAAHEPAPPEEDFVTIDSPMVGVFYAAPAPDKAPFVKPGDVVQEQQTVCIVEAMKLMNEVTAQFPARIVRVLVENGEPVEFGQPLFAVEPLE
ncbi:MAG TPA: acetyl-CoA carboxylase biotin carboxyl carrier protein [Candidatus Hydrogenedentes bacterium]|jgi:acetyl-CoA carboxylase biotin carboxyl carrier protein|nr:acetyl-CoA carboxylase biotin carboxyl carrier protein [Candidatus Hydrogenedentota bacterium]HPJ99046.1 acetyl-CoA carboxylase biotin carboxyl carrier protein [Candidatus Hydrogenedentota bacterium]